MKDPRRRSPRRRAGRKAGPTASADPSRVGTLAVLLLIPALAVIGGVLGYPLYRLFTLSFQQYGLFELIAHEGIWIGLDNYREILGDR